MRTKRNCVVISNQARTAAITDARTDAERLRNELAMISEKRSPDAIKAEIEAHKQHKRWGTTKECTEATVTESRLYCQAYNQLKADLATAERRDRLDVQLAGLKDEIAGTPGRSARGIQHARADWRRCRSDRGA